jgi:replicative DNA helicase
MIDRESLVLGSYYLDNPALRPFHAIIRPEQFQEPGTSMLFTVLQKYHQEYGRMPTHQEAEMEVRDYRGPKQHEEDCALELLGRYEAERAAAAPEPRWLERQASRFIDEAETTAIVLGFIAQLEKAKEDDDETASDQLLRHVSRVYDVREMLTQRPLAGLAFGAAEYVWDKFNSPQQRFQTGLPAIDELMNGGLARGQVGVIAAGSGVGKSMALCDLAAEAARGGASVLYINCESEDYELQARIVTNLADMRNDRYRALDLEGLKAVHERCAKYKVVVHDLLTSARPTDLVKAVEEFRYKFGHHPDVIIVDYLNELEPAKEGKNDTSYSTVGKNLKDMMKLAKRVKAALWTAVQFNP